MIRTITTWTQDYAPASMRWAACWGTYDIDKNGNPPPSGEGPSEQAAILDPLENYDLPEEPK